MNNACFRIILQFLVLLAGVSLKAQESGAEDQYRLGS